MVSFSSRRWKTHLFSAPCQRDLMRTHGRLQIFAGEPPTRQRQASGAEQPGCPERRPAYKLSRLDITRLLGAPSPLPLGVDLTQTASRGIAIRRPVIPCNSVRSGSRDVEHPDCQLCHSPFRVGDVDSR